MNSSFIIYSGAVLSAIGSVMVILGNAQLTKEIDRKQSASLEKSVEDLKSHFKEISKGQIRQINKNLNNEQEVLLIVSDLTLPEKWVLLRFIGGYQALKGEDREKMLSDLNDYYSKFPSKNREDPFIILNRKRLIVNQSDSSGITESRLTTRGSEVVSVMVKNKISPFDIIRGY